MAMLFWGSIRKVSSDSESWLGVSQVVSTQTTCAHRVSKECQENEGPKAECQNSNSTFGTQNQSIRKVSKNIGKVSKISKNIG